jgi:hypothetical protein
VRRSKGRRSTDDPLAYTPVSFVGSETWNDPRAAGLLYHVVQEIETLMERIPEHL